YGHSGGHYWSLFRRIWIFFFRAEDGIRDFHVTGVQTCALPISAQDSAGEVRPLTDILTDLADKGAGVADVLSIFGLEAGPKMQALLGRGSEGLRQLVEDLKNSEGAAEEMAAIRMEGLNGEIMQLKSAAQELMLQIGDTGLLDVATRVVQKMISWTQELQKTNPEILKWGTVIAAVAAAVGPLLVAVGMVISAIGQITGVLKILIPVFRAVAMAKMLFNAALWASPITWIVLAIIALIAVIVLCIMYWDEIKAAASAAWDWIVDSAKAAWDWLVNFLKSVLDWIVQLFLNWTLIGLVI